MITFTGSVQVSGVRIRQLYETSLSFFYDQTGRSAARGDARMKLRLTGAVKRLNVERPTSSVQHRTSNIDDATLYRFSNKRITLWMALQRVAF
jgi:hypothetical protein